MESRVEHAEGVVIVAGEGDHLGVGKGAPVEPHEQAVLGDARGKYCSGELLSLQLPVPSAPSQPPPEFAALPVSILHPLWFYNALHVPEWPLIHAGLFQTQRPEIDNPEAPRAAGYV